MSWTRRGIFSAFLALPLLRVVRGLFPAAAAPALPLPESLAVGHVLLNTRTLEMMLVTKVDGLDVAVQRAVNGTWQVPVGIDDSLVVIGRAHPEGAMMPAVSYEPLSPPPPLTPELYLAGRPLRGPYPELPASRLPA
jgi:hypothetical protein